MRKSNNFFAEDFEEFKPKKVKIAKKSRQMSSYELDSEDDNFQVNKRKKNVDYKRY